MKNNTQEQIDLQRQDIARILGWAYRLLPVGYGLIIIIRVITGGWMTVLSMSLATLLIPLANYFLKKQKIETSLLVLIISLVLPLNIAITFSNGIHDIGILAYPVILLISSLMIRTWQQIFSFALVLLSIMWLALGENYGYYKPNPDVSPSISELIIVLIIIIISAVICYRIASNLKEALITRDEEVQLTAKKIEILTKSLNQKIRLTNAIHLQVVESISIIRELVIHQKKEILKNLPSQLLAIELVHAELYRLELEKELDLENYIDLLFESQNENFNELKKGDFDDIMVNVDQALSIGIFLTELSIMNRVSGLINVRNMHNSVNLTISPTGKPYNLSLLAEIMTRQLNAQLTYSDNSLLLNFSHNSSKEG